MAEVTAAEQADADLILRAVYGEYQRVPASVRQRHRWVMDMEMYRFLRSVKTPLGIPLWGLWYPNELDRVDNVLLGLPVEVRDGIEGVHLEPVDG